MKKYRTTSYDDAKIIEVEVLKETAVSVFIATTSFGKKKEKRETKISGYHQYHDTWEHAYNYLEEQAVLNIEQCQRHLDYAMKQLKKVEAMKPLSGSEEEE